ncbi:hypothetical protein SEA_LONELYSOIL_65 [Microbacterium phage Lonelysoil]|nr:hypothetical protein SEA_BLAB_65 [Microbacterium phage Blab]WNM75176.1 hypothetical protein SEA_LONELYSOIL_65 [Microbacterium phage Lonelysoil]
MRLIAKFLNWHAHRRLLRMHGHLTAWRQSRMLGCHHHQHSTFVRCSNGLTLSEYLRLSEWERLQGGRR